MPLSRLATVELQLTLLFCDDVASFLHLARCSRHLLAAADSNFAAKHVCISVSLCLPLQRGTSNSAQSDSSHASSMRMCTALILECKMQRQRRQMKQPHMTGLHRLRHCKLELELIAR